jgi:predicted DNA-binding transcriptional regulator AlpA
VAPFLHWYDTTDVLGMKKSTRTNRISDNCLCEFPSL